MSNDNPNQDPFSKGYEQDPFVDDHFGQRPPPANNPGNWGNQGIPENLPDTTAVLVLGILSILGSFCYGIIGLILGVIAIAMSSKPNRLYKMDPNRYTASSYNNMKAGRVCAIVGLSISGLFVLFLVVVVLMALVGSRSSPLYF